MGAFERGQRRAAVRQRAATKLFSEQLTKNVDVETLLLDKLMQRTKGGSTGIMQQFRKLDSSSGDAVEISFDEFQKCLEKFGLQGLCEVDARRLFDKYDADGSNSISVKEFSAQVANSFNNARTAIGEGSTDFQEATRARERARILKQQALRTSWKTLSVDAERLLLQKLEQRIKGGPHSLRMAFRKFDQSGSDGDSAIDFGEFRVTLSKLGLDGVAEADARVLFNRFDNDGDGTISFSEFTSFVMRSSAEHNSLGLDPQSSGQRAKVLKARAFQKQNDMSTLHWRYAARHLDVEKLVVDKVQQKLRGGPHALRRAFCLFDQDSGGAAEITQDTFHAGLEALGFVDIPGNVVRRLFRSFDTSGDGTISFQEFIKHLSSKTNESPLEARPETVVTARSHRRSRHRHKHKHKHKSCRCKERRRGSKIALSGRGDSESVSTRSAASLPLVTGRSLINE